MSNHLLIAGTGRAGTSLLVKYFTALGLDTHVTKANGQVHLLEDANAGLEDLILHGGENLPYVVKSPWLYQFVDEVLAREDITIDGVIIPVRNLIEAASSRTIVELQNIHQTYEWMAEENKTWDLRSGAPGGILYSLNPLDQARLLAIGFHHLIERLSHAGIPIYLLAFPRFTEDPEYLFSVLRNCLPPSTTLEAVTAIHESIVEPDKVRVGAEIALQVPNNTPMASADDYPSLEQLDNIALRREIRKLRHLHIAAMQDLTDARSVHSALQSQVESFQRDILEKDQRALETQEEINAQNGMITSLKSTIDRINANLSALLQKSKEQDQHIFRLQEEINTIYSSTSWMITQPIRKVVKMVRNQGH
ncbi:hypothetical protein AB4Y96_17335 [Phyllobacterium sp. TAF24]|uniref:hypothetical protein n=1 Tax=Phyllobacterium sp. TAF24 TaxID=3233068 RepID=UPI003F955E58